jgi:hypothetical protein
MQVEVESHMLINPLNQLQSFDSKLRLYPFTGQSLVAIEGNVEGDKLMLTFRCGDYPQEKRQLSMPENKIRDSFSPETELRGLRLGQKWSIVTYNPFALPSNPLELLQGRAPTEVLLAQVEEKPYEVWNGQSEPMWLVVYRSDSSQGSGSDKNIRNLMWVRMDGTVVRQEVRLAGNRLMFSRMTDKEAAELRAKRKEFFSQPL